MPFIQRGTTHDIPVLEIRLDQPVLIFRGTPHESAGAVLSGSLRMQVREASSIRSIALVLQGLKRLHWTERPGGVISPHHGRTVKHEEVLYERKWSFFGGGCEGKHAYTVAPGEFEYAFSEMLDGSLPESVEGLGNSHIVYRLKARIVRGTFNHDIVAKKHLRIVRTLSPGALELSQTMGVENIWPNKVSYSISIPSKAVVFGTSVPIDIVLIPLLKGLTIGKVTCQLRETYTLDCPQRLSGKSDTRTVLTQTFTTGVVHEGSHEDELGRWTMHEHVQLPKSLNICIQDCEVAGIKVRHKLKFAIQLHNPDGHVSELRASLPVMLFISPHYLMDDDNRIPEGAAVPDDVRRLAAPPTYDEHYLDQLYDNVSYDAFDTPVNSGTSTPRILSSNSSMENLNTQQTVMTRMPDASSHIWHQRSHPDNSDGGSYFSAPTTVTANNDSGSSSPSPGASHVTVASEPGLGDLSKVPSYAAAIRSGPATPIAEAPPEYEVQSAPASPVGSPQMGHGEWGRSPRRAAERSRGRQDLESLVEQEGDETK